MNVITLTKHASTGNIIQGALQQAQVPDLHCFTVENPKDITNQGGDDCVVLVDWEGDTSLCVAYVKKVVENNKDSNLPVLLLSSKQNSGTTAEGLKAGACGIITKPVEPQALVDGINAACKRITSKQNKTLNVEFINPFIEATRTVFSTMAGMKVERKDLYLQKNSTLFGDISGVMGLSGEASGSVVISMKSKLALQIVAAMLQEEPGTEITADVCDGLGEILNMISGQAKASLAKTKYYFQISIPTVVTGKEHEIKHRQGTPSIVIDFETDKGEKFVIQVSLTPSSSD
ncbi:MAG: chemotaxis protein CheX [Planctomycetes bacterium]|nr:chemotaxis protein CheX [Planctomycetota bacterium]